jgi:dTDP-4-amino-4,6-dideoxygalactose transaminase
MLLSPSLTFVSTNMVMLYENMLPLFCDVDESLCLDLKDMEEKYEQNKDKVKGIMFVGLGGNVGQFDSIKKWAKERNLPIILDAAHMTGTRVNGLHVDPEVEAVSFSFQAVKNLPTGDSGAICFRDKEDDVLVRKLAWLSISKSTFDRSSNVGAYKWKYSVDDIGFKYNGNSIMAAFALVGLKYVDKDNAYRRQICSWYDQILLSSPKIKTVKHANCESSRHLYQVIIENRDEILMALNQMGIAPGVHYICNTEYEPFKYGKGTCPKAEHYQDRILSLPLHMGLTKADVDFVASSLNSLVK